MDRAELDRRQALCRAIFLLDDENFRRVENYLGVLQEGIVREKLGLFEIGVDRLPFCFGKEYSLQAHADNIRHYFKRYYGELADRLKNRYEKRKQQRGLDK